MADLSLKFVYGTFFKRSIKIYSPYTPKRTSVSHIVNLLIVLSFNILASGLRAISLKLGPTDPIA